MSTKQSQWTVEEQLEYDNYWIAAQMTLAGEYPQLPQEGIAIIRGRLERMKASRTSISLIMYGLREVAS